jgi:hypothetical protein
MKRRRKCNVRSGVTIGMEAVINILNTMFAIWSSYNFKTTISNSVKTTSVEIETTYIFILIT